MTLSIIIPAYNAATTLERAVLSCLGQDLSNYEIIIVDNNSTDDTRGVSAELARKNPVIRLAREEKQGAAAARNHGARLASGEWLQFVDADDVLLPGKINRQLGLVTAKDAWVIGSFENVALDGTRSFVNVHPDPWYALMYGGEIGSVNSNMFRRQSYIDLGGMKEEWPDHEDHEFYFRLLKHKLSYKVDRTPGSIYIHGNPNSLSKINGPSRSERRVRFSHSILQYLSTEDPAYFSANASWLNASLLRHLRQQATHDLPAALANFNALYPDGVRGVDIKHSLLSPLCRLYPLLGFYRVEKTRLILASMVRR